MTTLQTTIDTAWEVRDTITTSTTGAVADAVSEAMGLLDSGQARVAEKNGGEWRINQWLKKAVLLSFRLNDMATIDGGPGGAPWFDKVRSKFEGWDDAQFRDAGFRAVPNCIVRHSAYIAPGVILMPSFVNLGAYVDTGTMVDTWATVGSCAQIGKNCHISGGAGIGGVLEPLQASPVIIEDHCFIGARSEVAEGVVVEQVGPDRLHSDALQVLTVPQPRCSCTIIIVDQPIAWGPGPVALQPPGAASSDSPGEAGPLSPVLHGPTPRGVQAQVPETGVPG